MGEASTLLRCATAVDDEPISFGDFQKIPARLARSPKHSLTLESLRSVWDGGGYLKSMRPRASITLVIELESDFELRNRPRQALASHAESLRQVGKCQPALLEL